MTTDLHMESPSPDPGALDEEQRYRAGAYQLLGALLRAAPDQALLDHCAALDPGDADAGHPLSDSLARLAQAARNAEPVSVRDEYQDLFIGLGRGELVPYGSWYQTGFLMERPLGELRDDLAALGYERQADTHEPEDHVAALCEVMGMMILDSRPIAAQQAFFERHLRPWLGRFMGDLREAENAVFYRAVVGFGEAFFELESRYFSLPS